MDSHILELLLATLKRGFPVLLSFVDDALLLGLTRIGISVPWLQWLSILLLSATLIYWSFRIAHFLYQRYRVN